MRSRRSPRPSTSVSRPSARRSPSRQFRGVKRRMEMRGAVGGVTVYDDFAHHPTAIETTLSGLRARLPDARIIAVLEPRSNTMKLGVHRDELAPALAARRQCVVPALSGDLGWDLAAALAPLGSARALRGQRRGAGRGHRCRGAARRSSARHEQRRLRRPAREAPGCAPRARGRGCPGPQ